MPAAQPQETRRYTFAEYLALEEVSDVRHEYYRGEIFPLDGPRARAGATKRHNLILQNCAFGLRTRLRATGGACEVFTENVLVRVAESEYAAYPDVVVTCDPRDSHPRLAEFPVVIFEVLSDSTAERDRGWKLEQYFKLPSLRHYVLINQLRVAVDAYSRQPDGSLALRLYRSPEEMLDLPALGLQLPVADIYERIDISPLRLWQNDFDDLP